MTVNRKFIRRCTFREVALFTMSCVTVSIILILNNPNLMKSLPNTKYSASKITFGQGSDNLKITTESDLKTPNTMKRQPKRQEYNPILTTMTEPSMTGVSLDDIGNYNKWLNDQRQNILLNTNFSDSKLKFGPVSDNLTIAKERDTDYFKILSNNKNISTYALYINSQYNLNQTNIKWLKGRQTGRISFARDVMYPFSLERAACRRALHLGHLIGGQTCEGRDNLEITLKPFTWNGKGFFRDEYESMLRWYERIFLHVIKDARISNAGIIVQDQFYVEPDACDATENTQRLIKKINKKSWKVTPDVYDEVFVCIKTWSTGYFHWNVEDISRIAIYVEFLKQNPDIKILVPSKKKEMAVRYLKLLGLEEKQFISGLTAGKIVYLPQGGRCGAKASTYGLRLAVSAYANYIEKELKLKQSQDTIVLIHRTKKRYLGQHDLVKSLLEEIAPSYGLKFFVFSDSDLPSFNDTIRIFNSAAMVVAPHGGGLTNTVFSQPGTIVIEIHCPHGNFVCYPFLVRNLGHIYYSMRHDKFKEIKKCNNIWVDIDELRSVVNRYLSATFKSKP